MKYLLAETAALRAGIQIPEAELKSYYQQNLTTYQLPEKVRASHILLKTEGKSPEESEKVKAKATDLLLQVRKGADFAELAKRTLRHRIGCERWRSGALPAVQWCLNSSRLLSAWALAQLATSSKPSLAITLSRLWRNSLPTLKRSKKWRTSFVPHCCRERLSKRHRNSQIRLLHWPRTTSHSIRLQLSSKSASRRRRCFNRADRSR